MLLSHASIAVLLSHASIDILLFIVLLSCCYTEVLSSVSFPPVFKLILYYYLTKLFFAPNGFCLILLSHLLSDKPIFFFGQNGSYQDIFCPYIDLPFLCKTNASFEICQKQVAGHLEKEQRHRVKLRIGWSCHVVFNVAGQGPFSVMIEEISSRNGLLPLSNVHLLSVTDLLQQEDCCCYKRED